MRALGVIRLSVDRDESTSPARQREIITAAATARGSELVGWAEDLDVSASKTHPMQRPELAAWLATPETFDELLYWRTDRLVRKVSDFADMIAWADKHGKGLASATEPFDLATPIGKAMAYLTAIFAEMESSATSERVMGAHKYLRQAGRWAGGKAPYGYMAIPSPDGKGWKLLPDTETSLIVVEAVERVIAGEAVNAVVAGFNRRKLLSPRDHLRGEPQGDPWRVSSLRRILRSPALLGHAVHDGESVPGDDGMPVQRGPALITQTEFDQLQRALAEASLTKRRTQTPSMLLNVLYCAECGGALYKSERDGSRPGQVYAYYRCARAYKKPEYGDMCSALNIRCAELDNIVVSLFLRRVGDTEVLERIYRPAEDHSDEIAQVRRALEAVRAELDRGGYSYPSGQEDYDRRTTGLSERLTALAAIPVREAGYDVRGTGQSFRQRWESGTVQERRKLMLDAGFEVRASRTNDGFTFAWRLDPELAARLQAATAGEPVQLPGHAAIQASFEARGHSVTFGSVEDLAAWIQDAAKQPEGQSATAPRGAKLR